MHFVWNESKNKINKRKHKVSFEEAKTVFLDDYAFKVACSLPLLSQK